MKFLGDWLISQGKPTWGQKVIQFDNWLYYVKWLIIAGLDDKSVSLFVVRLQCPRWIVRLIVNHSK